MELYIYDPVNLVGIVDVMTSLRWRRKYFEPGEVELHVLASTDQVDLLKPGHVIRRIDRTEAAMIEAVEIEGNDLSVSGRMLSSVMERAIISKQYNFNTTTEQAILSLSAEITRIFPLLKAGKNTGLSPKVNMQVTYKNLLETVTSLAKTAGIGYRVRFELEGWFLECYQGIDHSINQKENPYVFFSDDFGNLGDASYSYDNTKYKNYALVAGEGEGEQRIKVEIDQSGGKERREIFVDAKDVKQDKLTMEEYLEKLRQRGLEKLADQVEVENFESEALNVPNFEYLKDWDLGDLVTCYHTRWGISFPGRVTEIEEVYENGVTSITPTLGEPFPETIKTGG